MKILKFASKLLALVVVLRVFVPFVFPSVPGFILGGTATAAPAVWKDTDEIDEVKLRVSGGLPRVVTIWMVQVENQLYVIGDEENTWVAMLGEGAPVKLRMEDSSYDLIATRISEGQSAVAEAYRAKYQTEYPDIIEGMGSLEEIPDGIVVFRLTRET